eukprot:6490384-Amphidinium_carterae.1
MAFFAVPVCDGAQADANRELLIKGRSLPEPLIWYLERIRSSVYMETYLTLGAHPEVRWNISNKQSPLVLRQDPVPAHGIERNKVRCERGIVETFHLNVDLRIGVNMPSGGVALHHCNVKLASSKCWHMLTDVLLQNSSDGWLLNSAQSKFSSPGLYVAQEQGVLAATKGNKSASTSSSCRDTVSTPEQRVWMCHMVRIRNQSPHSQDLLRERHAPPLFPAPQPRSLWIEEEQ